MSNVTQEYLTRYFHYDPDSGEFHRTLLCDRWGNESPTFRKVGTLRSDGYLEVSILGETLKLHRLAFLYVNGCWPEEHVDHINGDRGDNRWSNLRVVSRAENMKNKRLMSNNTSGHAGVTWFDECGKWRARINVNGKRVALGLFNTLEEAVKARKIAESELGYHPNHGTRARWGR